MRRLLIAFFAGLCLYGAQHGAQQMLLSQFTAAGGGGTWTFVQLKYQDSIGGGTGGGTCAQNATTCQVSISAPGAGHLLIAFVLVGGSAALAMNAPTGGQTWTHCAGANGCAFGNTTTGAVDAWYVLSATATGQTSVTCNFAIGSSNDAYNSCGVVEYAWSGSTIAFDTSAGAVDSACTTCASGSLTLAGADVVFRLAITIPGSGVTGITGTGYTSPAPPLYSGTGTSGKLNASSGTDNPTWSQGSSTLTVMGLAFTGS